MQDTGEPGSGVMKKASIVLVLVAVGIAAICILVLPAFPQENPSAPPSPFSVGILVSNRDNVSHLVYVSVSSVNDLICAALLENFTMRGEVSTYPKRSTRWRVLTRLGRKNTRILR